MRSPPDCRTKPPCARDEGQPRANDFAGAGRFPRPPPVTLPPTTDFARVAAVSEWIFRCTDQRGFVGRGAAESQFAAVGLRVHL